MHLFSAASGNIVCENYIFYKALVGISSNLQFNVGAAGEKEKLINFQFKRSRFEVMKRPNMVKNTYGIWKVMRSNVTVTGTTLNGSPWRTINVHVILS